MTLHFRSRLGALILCLGAAVLAGCTTVPGQKPADYAAIVAAPDRSDADRKTDERRDPVALFAFTGIGPGMRVLEMGAGAGYTAEMLARAVGPEGKVYAQDQAPQYPPAAKAYAARAAKPVMGNVEHVLRPYDDPLPPGVGKLDAITFFFAYHDTVPLGVDRAKMNRRLYELLKPGGVLIVADHSAVAGAGVGATKSLHRIEESSVIAEIEAAGFRLVAKGDFLRHPQDQRDVIVFRAPTPVDEFVLKFQKPQ
ncbi:MAG: class I SAM-dependent methyltransferase [Burkholderiaceae bacterium]|nr:class I SAM-dependent methyltransferase [Burkholderiaceae bacterium]